MGSMTLPTTGSLGTGSTGGTINSTIASTIGNAVSAMVLNILNGFSAS